MENLEVIHADPQLGLTEAEAQARMEAGLAAGVPSPTGKTDAQILLTHCFTFFNLIFLILAALLLIARSTVMNMGFLLVVIVNTIIGIFQELRAKHAVDQLALVARRPVTVVRDGTKKEIPPEDVIRDDIPNSSRAIRSAPTLSCARAPCGPTSPFSPAKPTAWKNTPETFSIPAPLWSPAGALPRSPPWETPARPPGFPGRQRTTPGQRSPK